MQWLKKWWRRHRERQVMLKAVRLLVQETGVRLAEGEELNMAVSMLLLSLVLAQQGQTSFFQWQVKSSAAGIGDFVHQPPASIN
jgi:hypothetical protein